MYKIGRHEKNYFNILFVLKEFQMHAIDFVSKYELNWYWHKSNTDLYIIHANAVNMHQYWTVMRMKGVQLTAIDWHKLNFKIPKNMQHNLCYECNWFCRLPYIHYVVLNSFHHQWKIFGCSIYFEGNQGIKISFIIWFCVLVFQMNPINRNRKKGKIRNWG